jgi:hypothetical protein
METKKKKIFIGSSVHRWDDIRVFYKQAISLAKHYDVELHILADFKFKEYKGVKIFGLGIWAKAIHRVPIILKLLYRALKANAAIVHFHDPELIPVS